MNAGNDNAHPSLALGRTGKAATAILVVAAAAATGHATGKIELGRTLLDVLCYAAALSVTVLTYKVANYFLNVPVKNALEEIRRDAQAKRPPTLGRDRRGSARMIGRKGPPAARPNG